MKELNEEGILKVVNATMEIGSEDPVSFLENEKKVQMKADLTRL